jgi:hypothetical protein
MAGFADPSSSSSSSSPPGLSDEVGGFDREGSPVGRSADGSGDPSDRPTLASRPSAADRIFFDPVFKSRVFTFRDYLNPSLDMCVADNRQSPTQH